jgi:hypothetical protein
MRELDYSREEWEESFPGEPFPGDSEPEIVPSVDLLISHLSTLLEELEEE